MEQIYFFFKAEDGIRDGHVTGVQTCALPIFYEANIFTAGGRVSAVIDLDSLGPGVREDDLATLLGHLAVLRELAPRVYPHVDELVDSWFTRLAATCDPPSLAARTAGVVLSLVAGTDHDQAVARLRTAEDWLQRAVRLAAESTAPEIGRASCRGGVGGWDG